MNSKEIIVIAKQIREIDTAVGMLLVLAMKDDVAKAAMNKISKVSSMLGQLIGTADE